MVAMSVTMIRSRTPNATKTGERNNAQPDRQSNTCKGKQHRPLLLAKIIETFNKNVL
jgi:hypothetical protein